MQDPFWQALEAQGAVPPEALNALHRGEGARVYQGSCAIERGSGPLVCALLWLMGFPPAGQDVPVTVEAVVGAGETVWTRRFGDHVTRSILRYDPRRRMVEERFGICSVYLNAGLKDQEMHLDIHMLRVLGLPVPKFLIPVSATREWGAGNGQVGFDVSARLPGFGVLIRYHGLMSPV